jgi:uncharacterized damage-inducible protein DinB
MTLQDLHILLDYNYWARDRMLEALDALTPEQFTSHVGGSFGSIRDTAAHMLGAEIVWYMRWQGESPVAMPKPDRFSNVAGLRSEWMEHEAKMRSFLASLGEADVTRIYAYKLTTGPSGSSPFWQMLQHLVNHGTYHRGQVTTLLRQMGAKPPQSTDMIGFYRQRQ